MTTVLAEKDIENAIDNGEVKHLVQHLENVVIQKALIKTRGNISKAEYDEIIELSESDIFGNLTLKVDSEEEFKNKYSAKRPNVILEKVGLALFGKSWKKALAEALEVDERRITHWLQCSRPIPKNVFKDLKVIKDKRLKEIQSIEKLLD